jgi:hypothetical protein
VNHFHLNGFPLGLNLPSTPYVNGQMPIYTVLLLSVPHICTSLLLLLKMALLVTMPPGDATLLLISTTKIIHLIWAGINFKPYLYNTCEHSSVWHKMTKHLHNLSYLQCYGWEGICNKLDACIKHHKVSFRSSIICVHALRPYQIRNANSHISCALALNQFIKDQLPALLNHLTSLKEKAATAQEDQALTLCAVCDIL